MYQMLCKNELSEYTVQKSNIQRHSYYNNEYTPEFSSPEVDGAKVNEWIADSFTQTEEDDLIIFYYTGHGSNLARGGIILGHNSDIYTWDTLTDALLKTASNHIIVILNSCYSGGFVSYIENNLSSSEQNRFSVITSSSAEQTSGIRFQFIINIFFGIYYRCCKTKRW